jgi:NADP-dependent 3-hydroxy acid dehydrogenase YdfG
MAGTCGRELARGGAAGARKNPGPGRRPPDQVSGRRDTFCWHGTPQTQVISGRSRRTWQRSIAIEADVTDRDSIVAAVGRVRHELGTADALINDAGVMLLGPFDSDQLEDGGGDIINIPSVAGRTARSGNGVYAATKWGINGWSESLLRQELLPDVRVTLIEPGVAATELPNHITHADTKQGVQQLYDKAEVTAAAVAEIIAFILSRPRRLAINEILLRPAGQQ